MLHLIKIKDTITTSVNKTNEIKMKEIQAKN